MLKLLLLTSSKIKKILLLLLIIIPLAVIAYFVYSELIDKKTPNNSIVKVKYTYKEPYAKKNEVYKVSSSKTFEDRNQNLIFTRCSISNEHLSNLDYYYCSIISKNYGNKDEVAIMQFAFDNVTEFFGQCLFTNPDETKYPNANICNYDNYESKKSKWFENVVFSNSLDFIIDTYNRLKFGPEMQLLDLITIKRGRNINDINDENRNEFGEYSTNQISVYISNGDQTSIINEDYIEAVNHLNSNKQSLFVGSFESLKQLIIEYYGLHIVSFNRYNGRNTRFDYTLEESKNPLSGLFNVIINTMKNAFPLINKEKYNHFVELFKIANKKKGSITSEERDRAIEIFQNVVLKDSSFEVKLNSLLPTNEFNYFFKNCDPNTTYKYRLYNNIPIITDDSKSVDKQSLYERIKKFFNWKTILSNFYLVLTSYSPSRQLSNCPNLYDVRYNYLNYYLSLKEFGLDIFKSTSLISELANLVFYNVINKINNFLQTDNKNFGLIVTRNEDEEEILDAPFLGRVSAINKVSYFTKNGLTYNKLFFVYDETHSLKDNQDESRYSIYIGSNKRGVEILPFDWNNIGYKRTFFSKTNYEYFFLNNNIGSYIASFNIDKKSNRRYLSEDNHFIFEDVDTPNFYYIGENQINLEILPTYLRENTSLWQLKN